MAVQLLHCKAMLPVVKKTTTFNINQNINLHISRKLNWRENIELEHSLIQGDFPQDFGEWKGKKKEATLGLFMLLKDFHQDFNDSGNLCLLFSQKSISQRLLMSNKRNLAGVSEFDGMRSGLHTGHSFNQIASIT